MSTVDVQSVLNKMSSNDYEITENDINMIAISLNVDNDSLRGWAINSNISNAEFTVIYSRDKAKVKAMITSYEDAILKSVEIKTAKGNMNMMSGRRKSWI
ncbi:hypothetical protein GW932_02895 [archaeon]|nr:hypothetical protein [archaeon]